MLGKVSSLLGKQVSWTCSPATGSGPPSPSAQASPNSINCGALGFAWVQGKLRYSNMEDVSVEGAKAWAHAPSTARDGKRRVAGRETRAGEGVRH